MINIDPELQTYADKLYSDVMAQFKEQTLTPENTFNLMRIAMETVDKYEKLAGRQKKELVLHVLHRARRSGLPCEPC